MNPLIPIIATYGIQFAIKLIEMLRDRPQPTAEELRALADKYAAKSADEYLKEAQERAAAIVTTGEQ